MFTDFSKFKENELFMYLNDEEKDYLLDVPVMISILIASSDTDLDEEEIGEAKFFAHLKKTRAREDIQQYYEKVGEQFDLRLQRLLGRLPSDVHERAKMITFELSKINKLFHKMDQKTAVNLYGSYKAFARHVAQASGGFLGYFAVTPHENDLLKLSMMEKQVLEEDDEEYWGYASGF